MPELPEVETVCRGLKEIIDPRSVVSKVSVYRDRLRFDIPQDIKQTIEGQSLHEVSRRAKYILWHFDQHIMMSHLGMTGSWRVYNSNDERKHDHFSIEFNQSKRLVYNDPRRFGFIDFCNKSNLSDHKYFKHLGPEPLSEQFNTKYLHCYLSNKNTAIKSAIMDQRCVVGVGNIYACEALFLSEVHPQTKAGEVSKAKIKLIVANIQEVLSQAIIAGGSTIKDFKKAGGEQGYFQHQFKVYGRADKLCFQCNKTNIENMRISGRSSFFCPNCQKLKNKMS